MSEDRWVFISYRRDETRHIAGRIADRIGADRVFMDVDTIEPGADFGEAITNAVESCGVLVAVIGRDWATATDQRGRRRLDNPDDFVVLEVGAALRRSVRVLPVLVDGATMPQRDDLPSGLQSLARRNAIRIDHETFASDVGRLLTFLERIAGTATEVAVAPKDGTGRRGRTATLRTSTGDIRIVLFPDHAPRTVANFVGLADGSQDYSRPNARGGSSGPFYDGSIFHRVISGFMIQGGDPTGTGRGGPGYEFGDEFHPDLRFDRPYLFAMANAGPATNGSQFFITVGPTPHLNRKNTIFGEVADAESRAVVDQIAQTSTGPADRPLTDVVIRRVEIEQT